MAWRVLDDESDTAVVMEARRRHLMNDLDDLEADLGVFQRLDLQLSQQSISSAPSSPLLPRATCSLSPPSSLASAIRQIAAAEKVQQATAAAASVGATYHPKKTFQGKATNLLHLQA